MLTRLLLAYVTDERAQDVAEYALMVALIAFGAIAGMNELANGLNNAFSSLSETLTTTIS